MRLAAFVIAIFVAFPAAGEGKRFSLSADPALVESGALKFILPRFSLKTGVKVDLTDGAADARLEAGTGEPPVFAEAGGRTFALSLNGESEHAARFRDWLTSEVGLRTVLSFKRDGAPMFEAVEVVAAVVEAEAVDGDAALGSELALRRCGRCHVIDKRNRFGGIGSTPSFGAMKNLPRWRERFEVFWTLNPHPSFTQIEDITDPFDPSRPPPIAPLELTLEEVEAIIAFVVAMERKDLGGALVEQ